MKSRLLLIVLTATLLLCDHSSGQALSAFSDYRGYLMAFENGNIRQLEYLPVKNYKMGSSCIAYVDNRNDFKVYYKGESKVQVNAADFQYWVTDYLVSFKVGQVLYVFDAGDRKTLCYYNTRMTVSDSLLCWFDDSKYTFNLYYDHKVIELENSLLEPPKSFKAGSNVLAWVNQSDYFQVFYKGNLTQLDNIIPDNFAAGRDIMAWVDGYDHYFHIFYNGDTATASNFAPDSFKVGFSNMAFVDQQGNFSVFSNGAVRQILSDRPDFFQVKGNVVIYGYNNHFSAFYNNKTYDLESYIPDDFQVGINGVAYKDPGGALKYFDKGSTYTVTSEFVNKYTVTGDVVKVEVGTNTSQFFWKGQLFD